MPVNAEGGRAGQGSAIFRVPSGPPSPEVDASFVSGSAPEVDGEVVDDDDVFHAVATAKARLAAIKRHTGNQVNAVHDGPVAARGPGGPSTRAGLN
jgi:hypothetical protein